MRVQFRVECALLYLVEIDALRNVYIRSSGPVSGVYVICEMANDIVWPHCETLANAFIVEASHADLERC